MRMGRDQSAPTEDRITVLKCIIAPLHQFPLMRQYIIDL